MNNNIPTNVGDGIATIQFNRWYRIEMQVTPNTVPIASDGIIRIWVNGTLVMERTDLRLLQNAGETFFDYGFGYQMQDMALYDEYRY